MRLGPLSTAISIALPLLIPVTAVCAKQPGSDAAQMPKNEIQAKVTGNYVALHSVHVPVVMDANRKFRSLEVEVWLLPQGEQNLALARSAKKKIVEGLQQDFSNYDWEAFTDSDKGPDIAKKVVTLTVERVCGAKLDDVLIKTLLLK